MIGLYVLMALIVMVLVYFSSEAKEYRYHIMILWLASIPLMAQIVYVYSVDNMCFVAYMMAVIVGIALFYMPFNRN